jgi:hypothetical protein
VFPFSCKRWTVKTIARDKKNEKQDGRSVGFFRNDTGYCAYCTGRYLADVVIFAQSWLEGMPL